MIKIIANISKLTILWRHMWRTILKINKCFVIPKKKSGLQDVPYQSRRLHFSHISTPNTTTCKIPTMLIPQPLPREEHGFQLPMSQMYSGVGSKYSTDCPQTTSYYMQNCGKKKLVDLKKVQCVNPGDIYHHIFINKPPVTKRPYRLSPKKFIKSCLQGHLG